MARMSIGHSVRSKSIEGADNFKEILSGISGVRHAQGHASAFGIGIDYDSIEEFKVHLNSIVDKLDFNNNLYKVDFISKYNNLNLENARILSRDDIWCHGVEKPIAVLTDIPIEDFKTMGAENKHVKINCGNYDVIIFNDSKLSNDLLNNKNIT